LEVDLAVRNSFEDFVSLFEVEPYGAELFGSGTEAADFLIGMVSGSAVIDAFGRVADVALALWDDVVTGNGALSENAMRLGFPTGSWELWHDEHAASVGFGGH